MWNGTVTCPRRFALSNDLIRKVENRECGSRQSLFQKSTASFTCNNPVHPTYKDIETRNKTYENWPHIHKQISVANIAEAGFFYIGNRDQVKCFYCNGGLQNWERDDDPWVEHAKWFPECEYVLQQRGCNYVAAINSEFPDLQRPGDFSNRITNPEQPQNRLSAYRNESLTNQQEQTYSELPQLGAYQNGYVTHLQEQTFSNNYSHEKHHHIEDNVLQRNEEDLISEAVEFGFDKYLIDTVVKRKHRVSRSGYNSLSELIEDIQILEAEGQNRNMKKHSQSNHLVRANSLKPTIEQGCFGLKDQLLSVIDEMTCKICENNDRSCVFTMCGHFCCCFDCGKNSKQCPLCNEKIEQVIKIYKV